MRLAEETILLLLNQESGYLKHVVSWNTASATRNALLDLVLAKIVAETPPKHTVQRWIEKP
ncbi:MAG: hypothetical protein F4039_06265 [Gammaproteobacteria bacterium]|nr:hypothetical protein [Gammaproteobacteria bacterium]MYF53971.1 hypothetical protein [Gammaproteobacteria bacterium]MYK43671.1 hypothetical protein [Gammaproteobacteria bacterium]